MNIITSRFVKDLALIVLFGVFFYALTHNSVVHPKPPLVSGFWSIQLMQHPLIFGLAGHNFLVLRDSSNKIMRELHGLATDNYFGYWKYVGDSDSDILRVWEFDSARDYSAQKDFSGILLYKGSRDDVIGRWEQGYPCKEAINKEKIPYPRYGVKLQGETENSNSVAYTLLLCMELQPENIGILTPGWGKNLVSGD